MKVVYADEVFLLNALVDYLLLLSAAAVAGEVPRRGRLLLGAALGGGYALLVLLPGWGFLAHPLCKLALGWAMVLAAFGASPHLLRPGLCFLALACAFAGATLALRLLTGAPAVLDLKTALLSAAGCYLLFTALFRRTARHGPAQLVPVTLEYGGRSCRLIALRDSGNTLTDPVTGRPVLVWEGDRAAPLFPPGKAPSPAQLRNPAEALTACPGIPWRLLPYRAVGVGGGLLLCFTADRATVAGEDWGALPVALSPTPLSDGGGYHALIGVE